MRIFFDTSSLFKLYHQEAGTRELMDFFQYNSIERIYLAEITKLEFASAVWKKCRKAEIEISRAKKLIEKFQLDSIKYSYIPDTTNLKALASDLIEKHWNKGLRTLDSLQLASGIVVKAEIEYFFTSDDILKEISEDEGLKAR